MVMRCRAKLTQGVMKTLGRPAPRDLILFCSRSLFIYLSLECGKHEQETLNQGWKRLPATENIVASYAGFGVLKVVGGHLRAHDPGPPKRDTLGTA